MDGPKGSVWNKGSWESTFVSTHCIVRVISSVALSLCEAVIVCVKDEDPDADDEGDTVEEKVSDTESRLSVSVSDSVDVLVNDSDSESRLSVAVSELVADLVLDKLADSAVRDNEADSFVTEADLNEVLWEWVWVAVAESVGKEAVSDSGRLSVNPEAVHVTDCLPVAVAVTSIESVMGVVIVT